jgi:hypothetical protein
MRRFAASSRRAAAISDGRRTQGGVHLPDQDLTGLCGRESALSPGGQASGVARGQGASRLEVHPAPGEVDVNERRMRDGDALAGFEPGDVEGGVAVPDPDRRLVRSAPR